MIREEYKKEQDLKKLTNEPYRKVINKDRSFYVSKMTKLSKSLKSYNFMAKFCIFLSVLLLIPIILSIAYNIEMSGKLIFIIVVEVLSSLFIAVWYLIWKPSATKKYNYCKEKVSELNTTEINKQKINYLKNKV